MATQIAATPVIKGKDAFIIFKEANHKPSYNVEKAVNKLNEKFDKMMKWIMTVIIQKLSKEHLLMVDAFTCTETKEQLKDYKSDIRRRIIKHSQEMESFLKIEALEEQEKHLNTTYLLIDTDENKIVGYISLCNDCIRLELEERVDLEFTYATIPAMKIARLAIDNAYKGKGMGKLLIQFSSYIAQKIQSNSGLVFITLDCYEHRLSYYESIGFIKNAYQPNQRNFDSPISMRILLDKYLKSIENEL